MRWFTGAASVAAAAMVLAGCGTAGEPAGDTATVSEPLRVVGPFEVHSLDPATAGGFFTRLQVAETLVEADTDGTLQPGLATSWEVAPDNLTWRFTLRDDAMFHDGTAVTGQAVAAALQIALDEEGTPLASVPVATIRGQQDVVEVALERPFAPLPAVLAHTSTQVLAPGAYGEDGTVIEVVGSGPYRVEDVEQPSRIDVVVHEGWAGQAPAVERVSYQAVGRAETRALMAESGQADVIFGIDPTSRQRLGSAAGVSIVSVTLPRTIQVKVNADHELLADPEIRRALSLALDRESMASAVLRDPEMAATQLFPPSLPTWHHAAVEPLTHDVDRARDLLAQAGWRPGPDGILARDGERFELSLRTFPDRPELPPLATAMQDQLGRVGVHLDVEVGNSSEVPAGHQDGTLQLGLYARNFALVPDPLVTLIEDFGPEGADWGAMGWADEALLSTLSDMAEGVGDDVAGRRAVAEILQRDLPVIPVAWYRQSAVVSERVDGFELDPLERSWLLSEMRWAG